MPKRNLFTKILLLMVLMLIIAGALVLVMAIREQSLLTEEALVQEHTLLAQVISQNIEAGYFAQRWPFEILKQISECENIVFWWIVKPEGKIYLADDTKMWGKKIVDPSLRTKERVIKDSFFPRTDEKIKLLVQPLNIEESGKQWILYLGISLESINAARKQMVNTSLRFFAIIIIFATIPSFYLAKAITKPLGQLVKGTTAVSEGNLDYKIELETRDEIGQLARSFNKMTSDLKKSRVELERYSKELEKRVEERTRELQKSKLAVLNILEDVNKEKEKSELERDKTKAILQGIGDIVYVVNLDKKISMLNPVAEKATGWTRREAIGKSCYEVFQVTDETSKINVCRNGYCLIDKVFRSGKVEQITDRVCLTAKNGTKIPVAGSASPVKGINGRITGAIVVLRDVTKEREIDKMKSEFVSIASHQLRTPLSAIKVYLEMLMGGDVGEISPKQKAFLSQAHESNERMIRLINDLLNVSRIEAGKIKVEPEPIQLEEIIEDIYEIKAMETDKKKLIFKFNKPKHSLPKVFADPERIKEALENLADNAIRYTHKGRVDIFIKRKKDHLLVSVADTGVGIPRKQQKRVFTKFFRGDNVIKMQTDGTGLGLYTAKIVIESLGGKIWFDSEEGKGTVFYLTLPISKK